MKKGRHRRYEEARKFKRSHEDNLQDLIESFDEDDYEKPEHAAWAEEFDATRGDDDAAADREAESSDEEGSDDAEVREEANPE